jgi:lysophospholipase L1-like esterase
MHSMLPVRASGGRSIWVSYCKSYIIPCLETHKTLDLVIIMLGTNDLKMRFSVSAYDIANGAGALVQIVQKSETGRGDGAPQVLLLAPPPVAIGRSLSAGLALPRCLRGWSAVSVGVNDDGFIGHLR